AAEDATFGLSEVNWGIIPGGLVSWNLTDLLLPRHALYYAVTGDTLDGKRAVEVGLVNFAVPKANLREETVKLAQKLMKLNPNVVRYTKEAIRAVRHMDDKQARDYLKSKQDSLTRNDKEIREQHGMKEFLDEKSYRSGLGPFRRVADGLAAARARHGAGARPPQTPRHRAALSSPQRGAPLVVGAARARVRPERACVR